MNSARATREQSIVEECGNNSCSRLTLLGKPKLLILKLSYWQRSHSFYGVSYCRVAKWLTTSSIKIVRDLNTHQKSMTRVLGNFSGSPGLAVDAPKCRSCAAIPDSAESDDDSRLI